MKLSPQHGLNPTMLVCMVCSQPDSIALCGPLPGDQEAPKEMPSPRPYESCASDIDDYMLQGITLVVYADEFHNRQEPYVTPWQFYRGIAVITEEGLRKMPISQELIDIFIDTRIGFIQQRVADLLGLTEAMENMTNAN